MYSYYCLLSKVFYFYFYETAATSAQGRLRTSDAFTSLIYPEGLGTYISESCASKIPVKKSPIYNELISSAFPHIFQNSLICSLSRLDPESSSTPRTDVSQEASLNRPARWKT